jgi:hypothetical protein
MDWAITAGCTSAALYKGGARERAWHKVLPVGWHVRMVVAPLLDLLRPLSYLGAARPLMLPLFSPPSLCVPTGPLYRIYRTNFGRCRDLDA